MSENKANTGEAALRDRERKEGAEGRRGREREREVMTSPLSSQVCLKYVPRSTPHRFSYGELVNPMVKSVCVQFLFLRTGRVNLA